MHRTSKLTSNELCGMSFYLNYIKGPFFRKKKKKDKDLKLSSSSKDFIK